MIARPTEYCIKCGRPMKQVHRKSDGLFIGDTFLRFEHDGECVGETENYKRIMNAATKLRQINIKG